MASKQDLRKLTPGELGMGRAMLLVDTYSKAKCPICGKVSITRHMRLTHNPVRGHRYTCNTASCTSKWRDQ